MPDYTGYDCDSFLPVETQEDWDRYQECLRQHRAVGNDPEQKGSREAFEGGQLDPNAPNYIYGQGSGGSGSNLGTPLYNWMDINYQFPGGLGVESIPGFFDKMSSAERSLATSMAGLQELQQGEADYGRRQLSDPTNYLSLFQVNPYRGNFYAENGGFMDGSMQPSTSSESMRFLTQIASETLKDTKNTAKRIKISEAYSRILSKVSNSRGSGNFVNQMGGEAEGEEFVPIQAEKGEKLIFSDGTTSPVKAKKKHSRMSDDDVTDIVPDGTYVVSDARKMAMTKDEASQYSLALINEPYKLKGKVQEPKEVTLADY